MSSTQGNTIINTKYATVDITTLLGEINRIADESFTQGALKGVSVGYARGEEDALDIDMDKPMHFTDEQKAWIKKYIIINAERQRADGAREFAEYIKNNIIALDCYECKLKENCDTDCVDRLVREWQKGEEND